MVIQSQLKISDKNEAISNVNVEKILDNVGHLSADFEVEGNAIVLNTIVPSKKEFKDLKWRLGAKRNRPTTEIQVLSYKEIENAKTE